MKMQTRKRTATAVLAATLAGVLVAAQPGRAAKPLSPSIPELGFPYAGKYAGTWEGLADISGRVCRAPQVSGAIDPVSGKFTFAVDSRGDLSGTARVYGGVDLFNASGNSSIRGRVDDRGRVNAQVDFRKGCTWTGQLRRSGGRLSGSGRWSCNRRQICSGTWSMR
jgi:hypothetical protein